nr:hypothetical protein BdHM001_22920 [Bdellovibrio sp. HM001]
MNVKAASLNTVVGLFLLGLAVQVSAAEKMYGVFMVVKGGVQIQSPGKAEAAAKVGAKVYEGDKVITAADSRAKIVMSDRNVLNLNPDTTIEIATYQNDPATGKKNVEIKLGAGKLRANVEQNYDGEKNKFQVKTPTAVAGVRGTQFQTGFDPKTSMTSIVTFKGSVAVMAVNPQGRPMGQPVIVKKGQMTTTAPNSTAPEAPKALPKEEIKQIENDSLATNIPPAVPATESGASREIASEAPATVGPEAAPTTSMIDSKDMDLGMAKEIKPVAGTATAPPNTTVRAPTTDTAVKDVLRSGGKTKVIIRPTPQ